MKLLLVEDDFDLSRVLGDNLHVRGYDVARCSEGVEALTLLRRQVFDAVVLDLSMPGLDGLEVLSRLRDGGCRVPVLVLTARAAVGERVAGLNVGADDYLTKPFDVDELDARLHALTRRMGRDGELRCGLLRYDPGTRLFYCQATPMDLSPRERDLLQCLMSAVDRVVPKDQLVSSVFAGETVQADAIEVLVHRLRRRLVGTKTEVHTMRGVGYMLRDEDLAPAAADARRRTESRG